VPRGSISRLPASLAALCGPHLTHHGSLSLVPPGPTCGPISRLTALSPASLPPLSCFAALSRPHLTAHSLTPPGSLILTPPGPSRGGIPIIYASYPITTPPFRTGYALILHSANIQTFFTKKRFGGIFQLFFFVGKGFGADPNTLRPEKSYKYTKIITFAVLTFVF
jgi:hypothetical protein